MPERTATSGSKPTTRRNDMKVLLREPEKCGQCNKVYLSLYPLRVCEDHAGLEREKELSRDYLRLDR